MQNISVLWLDWTTNRDDIYGKMLSSENDEVEMELQANQHMHIIWKYVEARAVRYNAMLCILKTTTLKQQA